MAELYSKRAKLNAELSNRNRKLSATTIRASRYLEYDYNNLINRPSIENTELVGNRSLEEIGVDHISNAELAALLD